MSFNLTPQTKSAMDTVFSYLAVSDTLKKADAIFVAGGSTIDPAIKTVEIYNKGYANRIFATAKRGTFSNPEWKDEDSVVYKNKMIELGVPEENIIVDPISKNSLEEADDSIYIMKQKGIDPKTVIIVDRPIHQRRECATFIVLFPEINFINCPADEKLEYTQELLDRLVAEVDRIIQFAIQGTLAKQEIPDEVMEAYQFLTDKIASKFGS